MSTQITDRSLADALVVDGLTVARGGRDVLREVSLEVPRGEITALLGPNGAGKSSLVLAIAGLLPARTGIIRIGSTDLGSLDPERVRAHGVATVPEGHRVLRNLSVSDNLRVAAARMTRDDEAAGRNRVLALLPELEALLERPAGKLSGGQQQMPAIGDLGSFLASSVDMDYYIDTVVATADHVGYKKRSKKKINVSFDEWNVWYLKEHQESGEVNNEWRHAPRQLEDVYSVADAVVVGNLLMTLLKRSDRVTSASLAQLVNVIAPITTEPGGPAWRQTTFHPFAITSRLAAGTVIRPVIDTPTYTTARHGEAPVVDAAATVDGDRAAVFLLVNRDLTETAQITTDVRSLGSSRILEALTLADADVYAKNTLAEQDRVVPAANASATLADGVLTIELPPVSWTAIALG